MGFGLDGRGDGAEADREALIKVVVRLRAQGAPLWGQVPHSVSVVLELSGSVGWGQGAVPEVGSPPQAGWRVLSAWCLLDWPTVSAGEQVRFAPEDTRGTCSVSQQQLGEVITL